jgi:hypothetical protein
MPTTVSIDVSTVTDFSLKKNPAEKERKLSRNEKRAAAK